MPVGTEAVGVALRAGLTATDGVGVGEGDAWSTELLFEGLGVNDETDELLARALDGVVITPTTVWRAGCAAGRTSR